MIGLAGATLAVTLAAVSGSPVALDVGRVVQHARGETRVPELPQRVVVLTNEATEAALALGVKPVGAVRSWAASGWHPHIAAALEGVSVVGDEYEPDLPAIAALGPDLILGNELRQAAKYAALSAIAPTVFSESLLGRWKDNLKLYARALGREAIAREMEADWEIRLQAARHRLPDAQRIRVAAVRFMPRTTRLYFADSFLGSILADLRFARAPTPPPPGDFVEELVAQDLQRLSSADVIFMFTFDLGDGEAQAREDEWTSLPGWNALPAVKGNRAFRVDDGVFNTSGGILAARLTLDEIVRLLGHDPGRQER